MDCSCAFGHADHAHVIEEREEVLPWQEESRHFAQRTEEASTGHHVRLPRAATGTVLIFPRITCRNCVDGSDKRNQPMELWDVHQLGQHRNQDVVINTDSVNNRTVDRGFASVISLLKTINAGLSPSPSRLEMTVCNQHETPADLTECPLPHPLLP